jgi:hypothetical protein
MWRVSPRTTARLHDRRPQAGNANPVAGALAYIKNPAPDMVLSEVLPVYTVWPGAATVTRLEFGHRVSGVAVLRPAGEGVR